MAKQSLFLFIFFVLLAGKSSSQDFLITPPKLEFDGTQLIITYDLIDSNQADLFFVWVEIERTDGATIRAESPSGDVGKNIKPGTNKQIIWVPGKDSIYLEEEVFVEVKAEKYEKSFNKGSALLLSTALPGLGQTKISKGKPWWLIGVVTYGSIAGGLVVHSKSLKTYDSYIIEEDPLKRADLFNQAQQQMNISSAMIVSGAALWLANIIWVAVTPNKYQPLQHVQLSLKQSSGPYSGTTLLSLRFSF